MISASTTAKASAVRSNWLESPNAYPVMQPEIYEHVLMVGGQLLSQLGEAQYAIAQNWTSSIAEGEVCTPCYGYFLMDAEASTNIGYHHEPARGNFDLLLSHPTVVNLFVASGDNITFDLSAASVPSFDEGLSDLRSITNAINEGSPLQHSAQFEALLDRALAARGIPDDLDTWARRLAENVRDLDD